MLLILRAPRPPSDGSLVPLGSTATHEPTEIPKSLWARRKSLNATNKNKSIGMSI
jgi:hypothetical protein